MSGKIANTLLSVPFPCAFPHACVNWNYWIYWFRRPSICSMCQ